MKKVLAIIVAMSIAIGLVGCVSAQPSSSTGGSSSSSSSSAALPSETEKVHLLFYTSSVLGDMGFADQGWWACQNLAEKYDMELTVVENGNNASTVQTALLDAIEAGDYDIVVTASYHSLDVIMEHANDDFKDIKFVVYDTNPLVDLSPYSNIIGIGYKQNESSFLAGVYQCMMTKTGKVGELAGNDNAIQNDFMTGWIYGVKWYNDTYGKNIEYVTAYRGELTLQATYETANVIYDQGVDILYNVASSAALATCQSCEEHGGIEKGYSMVGVDLDQYNFYQQAQADAKGYENIVTSALKHVEDSVYWAVEGILNDNIQYTNHALGLNDNGVSLCRNENYEKYTPKEVQEEMDKIEKMVRDGTVVVPRYFIFDSYEAFSAYRDDPAARI